MRHVLTIIVTILIIQSCSSKQDQKHNFKTTLKDCDEIAVIFFGHDSYLFDSVYNLTDSVRISTLSALITGNNTEIKDTCKPNGQIIFKKDKRAILEVDFSIAKLNYYNTSCDYVKYVLNSRPYISHMTKNAESLIDNILWTVLNQKPKDLIYTKP